MIRSINVAGPVFDTFAARALAERLAEAWRDHVAVIALDFGDVLRIETRGIAALVAQHRRMPAGAAIVLCRLGDEVRDAIEITQLVRLFDVYESSEAVELALSA
jgi:anti-anti-sigma factor